MVKLTCLLSTYYDLPLLQGRLDNLLMQKREGVDMEVIFIAERESDELCDVLANWKYEIYEWFKIIETDGIPTLYDAWNMGIEIAEGEYLTNVNTDDRLYPGALQQMIDILDNNPDIGVVYPDVHRVSEIGGEPFGTYTWA